MMVNSNSVISEPVPGRVEEQVVGLREDFFYMIQCSVAAVVGEK
jgi:hypothetical protein